MRKLEVPIRVLPVQVLTTTDVLGLFAKLKDYKTCCSCKLGSGQYSFCGVVY